MTTKHPAPAVPVPVLGMVLAIVLPPVGFVVALMECRRASQVGVDWPMSRLARALAPALLVVTVAAAYVALTVLTGAINIIVAS